MLEVTLYTQDALEEAAQRGQEPEGAQFDVGYVSLVNDATHGPPPLVAPTNHKGERVIPICQLGEEVLYINLKFVPAYKIKRVSD